MRSRIQALSDSIKIDFFAPPAILLGGTTMALVDDDKIKILRIKVLAVVFLIFVSDQLLIESKIDLIRSDGVLPVPGKVDLVGKLSSGAKSCWID